VSGDPARRPIGWWLKEADARIEAAFEARLAELDADRRMWQVLTTLAERPGVDRAALGAALAPFGGDAVAGDVLAALGERGWVTPGDDRVALTDGGAAAHARLAERVGEVRGLVRAALPGDDYVTLVRLLAQLVDGLAPAPAGA
jgi:hypothetical protein